MAPPQPVGGRHPDAGPAATPSRRRTVAIVVGLAMLASLLGWAAAPMKSGSSAGAADGDTAARAVAVGLSDGYLTLGATGHGCALTDSGEVRCWGNNLNYFLGSADGPSVQPTPVAVPVGRATSLAVGGGHTCAVLVDGGVTCWGSNGYGQLGSGSTSSSSPPTRVVGLEGAKSISAQGDTTCVVTAVGGVKCWGRNNRGQLGHGIADQPSSALPVDVVGLGGAVKTVSVGGEHVCALLATGGVECWGLNDSGQLGNNSVSAASPVPVEVTGLQTGATSLAAASGNGSSYTCAALAPTGLRCWGDNSFGQLAQPSELAGSGTPIGVADLADETVIAISAAAGNPFAGDRPRICAVLTGGTLRCWGHLYPGEQGTPVSATARQPVEVQGPGRDITSVDVSPVQTCVTTTAGAIKCWGRSPGIELGSGARPQSLVPVDVAGATSDVKSLSVGQNSSCLVTTGGAARCWGSSVLGSGYERYDSAVAPVDVQDLRGGVDSVSASAGFACAVMADESARCWGDNSYGQLGGEGQIGSTEWSPTPVDVEGLSAGVSALALGSLHACALLVTGGVECWGTNLSGQLGTGGTAPSGTATPVEGLASGVRSLSAGGSSTCAVLVSGGVKCWGVGGSGRLGNGSTSTAHATSPVDVVGLRSKAVAVSTGARSSCALLDVGDVQCWGSNLAGLLGNADLGTNFWDYSAVPVDVVGLPGGAVRSVRVGGETACAVTNAGAALCWGRGDLGQLGNPAAPAPGSLGTVEPVGVVGLDSGVADVAAGADTVFSAVCAVTSNGSARCWGSDRSGGLGAGVLPVSNVAGFGGEYASLVATPQTGDGPLVATFSFNGAGSAGVPFTGGTLDFGDGSVVPVTPSDSPVSHTYWSSGTYTATLTLTNGSESATASTTVTVQSPPAIVGTVSATPSVGVGRLTPTLTIGGSTPVEARNFYYRIDCGNGQGGKNGPLIPSLPAGPIPPLTDIHCTYDTPGSYTISVVWIAENLVDSAVTQTTVTVLANTAPVPSLRVTPMSGPAPLAATFTLGADDPDLGQSLGYTLRLDDRSGPDGGSTVLAGPLIAGQPQTLPPFLYTVPGVHTAVLSVTDGLVTSETSTTINVSVDGAPTAAVTVAPESGTAPLLARITASGSDLDNQPLTYRLDYGDGTPVESGPLPTSVKEHVFNRAGTFTVRLEVSDGTQTATATGAVTVTEPPLRPNAGADRIVETGQQVAFDGSSSTPTAGVSYRWDFGDGASADGLTATHTYETPGTYSAALTVTRGQESAQSTATITVIAPAPTGLQVRVTSGGRPVSSADVGVSLPGGEDVTARTGGDGTARLGGLPDGRFTVWAVSDAGLGIGEADISNGGGDVTIDLQGGDVGTASLTSERLTPEQLVAAGIDLDDVANQNVFQTEITLVFGPSSTSPTGVFGGYVGDGGSVFVPTFNSVPIPTCGDVLCPVSYGGYTIHPRAGATGTPSINFLVIPAKAKFLKEFFDVQMVVVNLAPTGFAFTGGSATLDLPAGLTLAPTAQPQSQSVALPDIAAKSSRTASWIVRGDLEGDYHLAANYAATLNPSGRPVAISARTQNPLKVWGGSAIKMIVQAADRSVPGSPYQVRVGLENIADIPVYNASVGLLTEGKQNYAYQPRELLEQGAAKIEPGVTFWADYTLVPQATGPLDLSRSFIRRTGGNVTLQSEIQSIAAADPATDFQVLPYGDGIGFSWTPVPGATDYQVFARPNAESDFTNPLELTKRSDSSGYLDGDVPAGQEYALSFLIDGRPTMIHPVRVVQGGDPYPRVALNATTQTGKCGRNDLTLIRPQFEDPAKGLSSYRITGTTRTGERDELQSGALSGSSTTVEGARPFEIRYRTAEIEITAADGTVTTRHAALRSQCATYVALGDSFSSGEGVPPFESETDTAPVGVKKNKCHRSESGAYADLLMASPPAVSGGEGALSFPERLKFVACSGATFPDLRQANVEGNDEPAQYSAPGGLNGLGADAEVVTLTMGGNDLEFVNVVMSCLTMKQCGSMNEAAANERIDNLYAKYERELLRIRNGEPNAGDDPDGARPAVYLLGYPKLFSQQSLARCDLNTGMRVVGAVQDNLALLRGVPVSLPEFPRAGFGLDDDEVQLISRLQDRLEGIQATAARRAGVNFVPSSAAFAGREICADDSLFRELPVVPDLQQNAHPNALGQQTFAELLRSSMSASQLSNPAVDVSTTGPTPTFNDRWFFHNWTGPAFKAGDFFAEVVGPDVGKVVRWSAEAQSEITAALATSAQYATDTTASYFTGVGQTAIEAGKGAVAGGAAVVSATKKGTDTVVLKIKDSGAWLSESIAIPRAHSTPIELEELQVDADGDLEGTVELPIRQLGNGPHALVIDGTGADGQPRRLIQPFVIIDGPSAPDSTVDVPPGGLADGSPNLLADAIDPITAEPLIVELDRDADHGKVVIADDGTFAYTPEADFTGDDSFTYRVTNTIGVVSDPIQVTLRVGAAPPVAADDSYSTEAGTTLRVAAPGVLANDTNPGTGTLSAAVVDAPRSGTLRLAPDGAIEYQPAPGFVGRDSFTYRATRPDGATSRPTEVSVEVTAPCRQLRTIEEVSGRGVLDNGAHLDVSLRRIKPFWGGKPLWVGAVSYRDGDRTITGIVLTTNPVVQPGPGCGSATIRVDAFQLSRWPAVSKLTLTVSDTSPYQPDHVEMQFRDSQLAAAAASGDFVVR